jgi:GDPmannose 4,6-dehydratase
MRRAIVVGSSGQDGRLLRDQLLGSGTEVIGVSRKIQEECPGFTQARIDVTSAGQVADLVRECRPAEVYYLAAYHHSSQEMLASAPLGHFQESFAVHVSGLLHFLEAIRHSSPATRLFYAASSLVFGDPRGEEQDEQTPMNPECAYGITKTAGIQCCRSFRQNHGVFAATGILYNHESILREEKFVSQRIVRTALRISRGEKSTLVLGDLSARVDWGYAPDYVAAMSATLALTKADDFVIATGTLHSIRDFVEAAFSQLGLDWREHVREDPSLLGRRRPPMRGNPAKLRALTGWKPTVSFEEMVHLLITAQHDSR